MVLYIVILISGFVIAFLLGWRYRINRDRSELNIAMIVIANLKATIEIYKSTIEQQENFDSKRYTDLKIENEKLRSEIVEIKEKNAN